MSDIRNDFSIPNVPGPSPNPVSFSELDRATNEAQAARTHAVDQLAAAGKMLFTIGQDASFANMQTDILHMKEDVTQRAIDLVAQGAGKGYNYVSDENGNQTIQLGDDFQKTVDAYQDTLTEKYKNYPAVQKAALDSFDSTVLEAHKAAYGAATKAAVDDGKQAVLNNFDAAVKSSIESGTTGQIDAVAANPISSRFLGAATVEQLRVASIQKAKDAILQKSLDVIAATQGADAAILAIPEGLPQSTYDALRSRILTVGNAAEGASVTKAVSAYDQARANGDTDTDAQQTALIGVPDVYGDAAQKAVQYHATRIVNQADDAATKKLEDSSLSNGYAAALKELNDPNNKYSSMLKPGSYRTWDSFLNKMANQETNAPLNLNDPAFLPYMLDAFDKTKGEQQKLQEWRDAVNAGKITGKQFDWLNQHQKYNSDALHNVITMIHDKTVTNPKTGMVDLDPVLGMHVINSVEEFVINRSKSGTSPDPGEIQNYADKLVADEMSKNYQKYFEDSFASTGWAQFWGLGPIDANKLNDVQNRIEAGDFQDYGKTTEGQQKLALVRTAQQTEFSSLYPNIKIGAVPAGKPAMDDMGRQFLYSGANEYTRIVQNGKGVWAVKKVGASDNSWALVGK